MAAMSAWRHSLALWLACVLHHHQHQLVTVCLQVCQALVCLLVQQGLQVSQRCHLGLKAGRIDMCQPIAGVTLVSRLLEDVPFQPALESCGGRAA